MVSPVRCVALPSPRSRSARRHPSKERIRPSGPCRLHSSELLFYRRGDRHGRADGSQYTVLDKSGGVRCQRRVFAGRTADRVHQRPKHAARQDYILLPYSELYVMNADGSNVKRITRNVGLIDFEPAWSPDGERIVVARGASTPPPPDQLTQPTDLWIIDLASGRERQLTNSPATWEGWPHWSPDGRRIAFEGDLAEPGNNDIYTVRVDGSDFAGSPRGRDTTATPTTRPTATRSGSPRTEPATSTCSSCATPERLSAS